MRLLIAPDKFKGSLTGLEVIEAIRSGVKKFDSTIKIDSQLLADGGEGTLEIIEDTLDVDRIELSVQGPLNERVNASYLFDGKEAYIEMAKASGLLLLEKRDRNPLYTSTYGTGQLIKDALSRGAQQINLFVGGSATNDAGLGMARALGYEFYNQRNELLQGKGSDMGEVHSISNTNVLPKLSLCGFRVLTDVKNSFLGKDGAAHVYAEQKGANPNQIQSLEKGAEHLASFLSNGYENEKGAGAAGGMGYGAKTFLNAEIESGIDFLLELTRMKEKVQSADLVISGEGSIDHQSLEGKVVIGLYDLCKDLKTPLAMICGRSSFDFFMESKLYQVITAAQDTEDAMTNAAYYIKLLTEELLFDFRS